MVHLNDLEIDERDHSESVISVFSVFVVVVRAARYIQAVGDDAEMGGRFDSTHAHDAPLLTVHVADEELAPNIVLVPNIVPMVVPMWPSSSHRDNQLVAVLDHIARMAIFPITVLRIHADVVLAVVLAVIEGTARPRTQAERDADLSAPNQIARIHDIEPCWTVPGAKDLTTLAGQAMALPPCSDRAEQGAVSGAQLMKVLAFGRHEDGSSICGYGHRIVVELDFGEALPVAIVGAAERGECIETCDI